MRASVVKYPNYKLPATAHASGSFILNVGELQIKTLQVMQLEGYDIEPILDDFIIASFQDAIQNLVKYDGNEETAIQVLNSNFDATYRAETTWTYDVARLIMAPFVAIHPFGMWNIRIVGQDIFVMLEGNYAEMVFGYLKSRNELPSPVDVWLNTPKKERVECVDTFLNSIMHDLTREHSQPSVVQKAIYDTKAFFAERIAMIEERDGPITDAIQKWEDKDRLKQTLSKIESTVNIRIAPHFERSEVTATFDQEKLYIRLQGEVEQEGDDLAEQFSYILPIDVMTDEITDCICVSMEKSVWTGLTIEEMIEKYGRFAY